MAAESRTYVVLVLIEAEGGRDPMARAIYAHLGTVEASDADRAISLAIERGGIPDSEGLCIAVPETNWSEREVVIRQEPVIEVKPRVGVQAALVGD